MKTMTRWLTVVLCWLAVLSVPLAVFGQAGFDDDRVMLQGFYWESYRHGHPDFPQFGERKWYAIVRDSAETIRDGRFDLVWLPPPSYAGAVQVVNGEKKGNESAGYNPKQYFKLGNSYGSHEQHRAMLERLLANGIEPVADIVINHRDGTDGWTDFKDPDWGRWSICREDEAFYHPKSEAKNTPLSERGAAEERPYPYAQHDGTTYQYGDFRDLDHTSERVRRDIIRYLLQLRSMGYRGWRYDMVHGFHARWIVVYNRASKPTFSVGEYDWDKHAEQRGWMWFTATKPGDLKTASSVFDFSTQFTLKDNKGNYTAWYGFDNGLGMVGDNTDGIEWKNRAVTFLENHDTGYRTNDDGTPQEHHLHDCFQNNWQVEQAYAYILTHPGVPCVYWKHYFDWGDDLRDKIKALINARKVAGIHAGSGLHVQANAREKNVYAARVVGKNGDLYVRAGGTDADWQPQSSNYSGYREYAAGEGWKVWVGLPENPETQSAPVKAPIGVPEYRPPEMIEVPDAWLN